MQEKEKLYAEIEKKNRKGKVCTLELLKRRKRTSWQWKCKTRAHTHACIHTHTHTGEVGSPTVHIFWNCEKERCTLILPKGNGVYAETAFNRGESRFTMEMQSERQKLYTCTHVSEIAKKWCHEMKRCTLKTHRAKGVQWNYVKKTVHTLKLRGWMSTLILQ